jgi:hypothetical protein
VELADYLSRYPMEVLAADDAGEVFDRYHTPDIVFTSDGVALDRDRLIAHVRPARARADGVSVTVEDVLAVDARVAARYVLTARMRRGSTIVTEITMFGEVASDGRLSRVDQVTRDVSERAA